MVIVQEVSKGVEEEDQTPFLTVDEQHTFTDQLLKGMDEKPLLSKIMTLSSDLFALKDLEADTILSPGDISNIQQCRLLVNRV